MHFQIHRRYAVACCFLLMPGVVSAWGDDGHKIVGLIAEHYLDPAVRTQVDTLLAGDQTGLVSPVDIPDEATWADKYRDSDRNSTKVRYDQTHNWHYVDIEIGAPDIDAACFQHPVVPAGTPASASDPNDCVVDKISQFATELADPTTEATERRMALEFVLHFVGDLHQPLHAADDHDQGGNAKKVTGCGSSSNLHSCWDTPLVTGLGTDDSSIASALIGDITPAQQAQWATGTPPDWAQEAFQLAKTAAYGNLPPPAPAGSYALDAAYIDAGRKIVAQQLSRAGVRLAMVLNHALETGGGSNGGTSGGTTGSDNTGPTELLGNPGFENGSDHPSPWIATADVISNDARQPPHAGTWDAWLNGYGRKSTDTLAQVVSIPDNAGAIRLGFWLHVDTDETSTTKAFDTLQVQVTDTSEKSWPRSALSRISTPGLDFCRTAST